MKLDRDAAVAAVAAARRAGSACRCSRRPRGSSRSRTRTWRGAIRSRTIQKGHDPREFALVAFGGAGPLHAAEVADSLGIPEVIVPPYPGITSAMGLLTSDLKYDQMRTVFMTEGAIDAERLDRELAAAAAELRGRLARRRRSPSDEIEVAAGARLPLRRPGLRAARHARRTARSPRRRSRSSTACTSGSTATRSATRSRSSTSASPRSASGRGSSSCRSPAERSRTRFSARARASSARRQPQSLTTRFYERGAASRRRVVRRRRRSSSSATRRRSSRRAGRARADALREPAAQPMSAP